MQHHRLQNIRLLLRVALLGHWLILSCLASAATNRVEVMATGDRVNLRMFPDYETGLVVGQVNFGDRLFARSITGEWVEVESNTNVNIWAKSEFIQQGKVKATRLRLRRGPTINHRVLAILERGEAVQVLSTNATGWCRIGPRPDITVWIHRDYVKPVKKTPSAKPASEAKVPDTPGGLRYPANDRRAALAAPIGLQLIPLEGQGRNCFASGILRKSQLSNQTPSRYRLTRMRNNQEETVCWLADDDGAFHGLTDRAIDVAGSAYWLQGKKVPLVVPRVVSETIGQPTPVPAFAPGPEPVPFSVPERRAVP